MSRDDAGRGRGRGYRRVFRLPFTRARIAEAVDEELRFHLEGRIEELVESGLSRDDAEREARRRFGDYENYRRQARAIDDRAAVERERFELWSTILRESRRAARALVRAPAFSLVTLLTLALGIGATTAIYTVLEGVVLRPLPYRDAGRLVAVLHPTRAPGSDGERKWGLSAAGYGYFREQATTLDDLGIYRTASIAVTSGDEPAMARVGMVTASVFTTLQARPAVGRLLGPADNEPGAPPVVVLSHDFWRNRFAGDPAVVDRPLRTAYGTFTIVGVAERGLTLPKPGPFASTADLTGFGVDIWTPLTVDPAAPAQNHHPHFGVGRLREGATVEQAQREMQRLADRFPDIFPSAYSRGFIEQFSFRTGVTSLRDEVLGPAVPRSLWILFASVALVLVIACANVANLFMVRMEARRRDLAIRTALGADRRHLAVHSLAESLMLTMAAGVAGILLSRVAVHALVAAAPRDIPRLTGVGTTTTTVAFALVVSFVIGVVFGSIPVFRRRASLAALRDGGRGLTPSPRQRLTRGALVVSQVAVALMLLAGAGLMIRSFTALRQVRAGLDPSGILVVEVSLPNTVATFERGARVHREIERRVAAIPGVISVGATTTLPLRDFGTGCSVVAREGRPYRPDEPRPCVATPLVTPGFFRTLGIPMRGRESSWGEIESRAAGAVVTQALADRLWPGEEPLGKGLNGVGPAAGAWFRVIGVVPDLRAHGLESPATEAVFYPAMPLVPGEESMSLNDLALVVKTRTADPLALVVSVRRAVHEVVPTAPVSAPTTMDAVVRHSMGRTSFLMLLLGVAAGMALLLSAVGIYGVISSVVAQRRSEIGIRMALGAQRSQVAALVVRQSATLATIGVLLGLVGALAATRVLRSLLFQVTATDPLVLVTAIIALLTVAIVASFAPARRAASVDPVEAIRG